MKWYKHDPDAFIAGVIGLTLEERGAYITVLNLLYSRDGDISTDDEYLAHVCGCRPQTWRRIRDALISKGKIRYKTDGKLTANRVETTIKEAVEFSQTQKIRASLRWKTEQNQSSDDAKVALPIQPQPQPQPQPEKKERESRSVDRSPSSSFLRFWAVYPNKVGKGAALAAFRKIEKNGAVPLDELMAGLDRYCRKTDDRPWCNPATWLNQFRWEDQPVQVSRKSDFHASTGIV